MYEQCPQKGQFRVKRGGLTAGELLSTWWVCVCEFVCSRMLLEIKTWFVEASCCEWGSEALGLLCTNRKMPEALIPSNLGWSRPFLSGPSRILSQGGAPNTGPCARPPLLEGGTPCEAEPLSEERKPAVHLC